MKTYYAGIGSRKTPPYVLDRMRAAGTILAECGIVLRSGAADGADKAFEEGCNKVDGPKEIFLPWKGFNGSGSNRFLIPPKAYELAEKFHPRWSSLKEEGRKFMARNCQQALGMGLNNPTDLILYWTPGGEIKGGTGQALRIAKAYDIPTFYMDSCQSVIDAVQYAIKCKHVKSAIEE